MEMEGVRRIARAAVATVLACALLLGADGRVGLASAQGEWRAGRGTFYGNEPWLWSIHEGSCEYYYIWPDEPLGWDVAALPDAHYEYDGSCGRCYEVACDPMYFKDNYGNELDRTEVCYNADTSVVVRITDTCPCNYGDNYYSNKRWCCGDMDHFDLSVHSFEKLADLKWGVIGLKYRPVPCDYTAENPAPVPANPSPGVPPPPGSEKPWPPRFVSQKPRDPSKRPAPVDPKEALEPAPTDPVAMAFSLDSVEEQEEGADDGAQDAPPEVSAFAGPSKDLADQEDGELQKDEEAAEEAEEAAALEDTKEEEQEQEEEEEQQQQQQQQQNETSSPLSSSTEGLKAAEGLELPYGTVMLGDIANGWQDYSWWVDEGGHTVGPSGSTARCKRMYSGGAVAFYTEEGKFQNTMALEFWVKTDNGVPDVNINLEGPKGPCRIVRMQDLAHSGDGMAGFRRYDVWLGLFDRSEEDENMVQHFSSSFTGCGGNNAWEVNKIVFKNDLPWYEQEMCLDNVRINADKK